MEEKKVTKAKSEKVGAEKPEKLSYEQLENIAHQLSEQSRELYNKLQAANMSNLFKRLDYLFKILENSHHFANEFIQGCISEIEALMKLPEETPDTPEE